MATETATMERTTEWNAQELREELKARGIPIRQLAAEAGEHRSNLSDVLLGCAVGPVRRARILAAARRLGLLGEDS